MNNQTIDNLKITCTISLYNTFKRRENTMKKLMIAIVLLLTNLSMFGIHSDPISQQMSVEIRSALENLYTDFNNSVSLPSNHAYYSSLIGVVDDLMDSAERIDDQESVLAATFFIQRVESFLAADSIVNDENMGVDGRSSSPYHESFEGYMPEKERSSSPLDSSEYRFNYEFCSRSGSSPRSSSPAQLADDEGENQFYLD